MRVDASVASRGRMMSGEKGGGKMRLRRGAQMLRMALLGPCRAQAESDAGSFLRRCAEHDMLVIQVKQQGMQRSHVVLGRFGVQESEEHLAVAVSLGGEGSEYLLHARGISLQRIA